MLANVWTVFKNNIKVSIFKKPASFIISLVAPLGILFIMLNLLNFSSGFVPVAVIDNDKTKASEAIVQFIKESDAFNVIDIDENEVENGFAESKIYAVIKINEGFENKLAAGKDEKIDVTTREIDNTDEMIKSILGNEVINIKSLGKAADGNKDIFYDMLSRYESENETAVTKENLSDLSGDYEMSQMFIGFIIFFMLLRGITGVNHYYEEKEENVFERFFVSPINSYEYYLADFLSNYLIVLIEGIAGIAIINMVGLNTGVSSLYMFVILAAVGLVSVTLAMCVRAFCSRQSECSMVFNFTTMVFVMVGGCFVPTSIMPSMVNKISYLIPIRWAMKSINSLQMGNGFISILPYIGVIILFAAAFFTIGVYKTSIGEKETR